MSENSNIYNIFSRLSNSNNIKEDLNEALCLIEKHFKHKYLTPIEQDIRCCSQNCASEPTKEITLLKACKPFTNDKGNIDNMINIINTVRTFNRICDGYNQNIVPQSCDREVSTQTIKDSAIHNDGIYEIDKDCGVSINSKETPDNNIFLILLVLLLFNK